MTTWYVDPHGVARRTLHGDPPPSSRTGSQPGNSARGSTGSGTSSSGTSSSGTSGSGSTPSTTGPAPLTVLASLPVFLVLGGLVWAVLSGPSGNAPATVPPVQDGFVQKVLADVRRMTFSENSQFIELLAKETSLMHRAQTTRQVDEALSVLMVTGLDEILAMRDERQRELANARYLQGLMGRRSSRSGREVTRPVVGNSDELAAARQAHWEAYRAMARRAPHLLLERNLTVWASDLDELLSVGVRETARRHASDTALIERVIQRSYERVGFAHRLGRFDPSPAALEPLR